MSKIINKRKAYEVKFGRYAVFFNKNYRYIYIVNEIMLGLEFIVGSAFFLFESLKTAGIIIFIVGSAQLLIRPILKILHAITLRNVGDQSQKNARL